MGMVEARIEHVTVYAKGARVRRVTNVDRAAAGSTVRISGLPIAVIDDTVRVEVEGAAVATNVRTGVDAPAAEDASAEDTAEVRDARKRMALAEAEVERLSEALEQAQSPQVVAEDPTDESPAAWTAIVAARRALVAIKAERVRVLHEQLRVARREREDAERALTAAVDRDRRAGTARAAKLHELRKYVDVELTPTDGEGDSLAIRIEYLVWAARWAPSYVAKLGDGDAAGGARFEIRANVAQASGEDWIGVPLALSTAEPTRFAALPELLPLRIGRKQDEPGKRGFRAPPVGAGELYADFDRERSPRATGGKLADNQPVDAKPPSDDPFAAPMQISNEIWDESSSHDKQAFDMRRRSAPEKVKKKGAMPSPPPPPAQAAAMPAAAPAMKSARGRVSKTLAADMPYEAEKEAREEASGAGYGGGLSGKADDATRQPHAPSVRLDYSNLRMAPPSSPSRGELVVAPPDQLSNTIANEVSAANTRIATLPLPFGCSASWSHTYDYAFATDGAVDVTADGAWHSIAVTAKPGTARVAHVAVPREQADVFRVASIANPFTGPLLPGPIDVYDRGRFLVTSNVDYTPPAGTVDIGLGVDPAVKIARNTEYREEATGMLRGGLRLFHSITIDVENLSGRSIELEVRERIPVTRPDDDDIEVTLGKVEPAWERWTPDPDAPVHARLRGGHRWRLAVPAGQKQKLRASYEIKIASKHELVGGNRREL